MSYTLQDLMDKFISIENIGYGLFKQLSEEESVPENVKMAARVFAREEKRHIILYEDLKERCSKEYDAGLDFGVYDKADRLIYHFKRMITEVKVSDLRNLLEFCLSFERENLVLVLSIQNMFRNAENDSAIALTKIFDEIVSEEQKHVSNIESFLK